MVPVAASGQTVHVDSGRIVYTATVRIDSVNRDEMYARARKTLLANIQTKTGSMISEHPERKNISAEGRIRLSSPYHLIKTVEFLFELSVADGTYRYRIDSVYLTQTERGQKETKISSEELLKGMDVNGPVSAATEKQLNEIDMNFQKLVDLVNTDMKKTSDAKIPQ